MKTSRTSIRHGVTRAAIVAAALAGILLLSSFKGGNGGGRRGMGMRGFMNSADRPQGITFDNGNYLDGVYEGEANGYRPGLKVEVTVENGSVTGITVISHNEVNRSYWGRPVAVIPNAVLEAGGTNVDAVSGATRTSWGIMSAVENALEKALP